MRAESARSDRALPHSVEAEQNVLGALLLEGKRLWPLVAAILNASDFYRPDHRLIFAAIAELASAGTPPDVVTVEALLERRGKLQDVGGFAYLGTLARDTISAENIEYHAGIVRDCSALRQLLREGERIVRVVHDRGSASVEALIAEHEQRLAAIRERSRTGSGLRAASELVPELIDDLDRRSHVDTALRTGLADFDDLTGGLEPGDLVVVGARPSMGKTALLVSVAAHIARTLPVAIFSAEMPAAQLMRRCLALVGKISLSRLKRPGQLTDDDWTRMTSAAAQLVERHLWIDDRGRPAIEHIRAEAVALNARARLGCVLVDYLQLLEGQGQSRYEQLQRVSYGLKALAKELSLPVIALAQVNRGVETRDRHDRRPHMSDLRDCGGIEEAADVIAMLYSESYYDSQFPMPHIVECAIEKNRNGERGQCLWHFDAEHSHLVALDIAARADYRKLLARQSKPQRQEFDG